MKNIGPFVIVAALLLLGTLLSFTLGRYPVSLGDLWAFCAHLLSHGQAPDSEHMRRIGALLLEIRLPRIMAALLVGAALSSSGATFQAMFINPLVSPGLLGVLAGASFGAALAMLFSTHWQVVQLSAFVSGLVAVGLTLALAHLYRGDRLLLLILSGVISGSLFTSFLSILKYLADPYNQLPAIVYWLMGGFTMLSRTSAMTLAPCIVVGLVVLLSLSRYLNVLTMGDEEARSLGLRVTGIRLTLILTATLISSITVAIGGIIGWVGLVIPHMGRMLVGPDNRRLLPMSAMMGGLFLLLVDDVSRLMLPIEVPLGILTSLLGIPVFAVVLRRVRRGWS